MRTFPKAKGMAQIIKKNVDAHSLFIFSLFGISKVAFPNLVNDGLYFML